QLGVSEPGIISWRGRLQGPLPLPAPLPTPSPANQVGTQNAGDVYVGRVKVKKPPVGLQCLRPAARLAQRIRQIVVGPTHSQDQLPGPFGSTQSHVQAGPHPSGYCPDWCGPWRTWDRSVPPNDSTVSPRPANAAH